MGVDINCLPPSMQRQALAKMQAQNKAPVPLLDAKQPTTTKFHNTPTESKGIKFQGKTEAGRYDDLMLLQKAGAITDLRLQVNFTLQEGYTTPEGKRVRPIIYKADFTYWKNGEYVVEDVKSTATLTKTYLIKKKMLQSKFKIEIKEVYK